MNATNIIIVVIVTVIVGLAALYIYKAKKSGRKCIGCPDGNSCKKSCSCCSSCPSCNGK